MATSLVWVCLEAKVIINSQFSCGRLTDFLSLSLSLFQLAIEAAVGIAVFVRCFVNKKKIEAEIVDKLGNGFSQAPFATVVVISVADISYQAFRFMTSWNYQLSTIKIFIMFLFLLKFLCRLFAQCFHCWLVFH